MTPKLSRLTPATSMSLQENMGVLTSLVRQDFEKVRAFVSASTFDFPSFERFIVQNQLSGYLYALLASSPARDLFPDHTLGRFIALYLKQQANNRRLLAELKQLLTRFSAAGQEFILLKGLYLAQRIYGDIDRRALWDIDILVRKTRLRDVQKLLVNDGYVRKSHIFLHEDLSSYFTHAFDFAKKGISLDLHWVLSRHPSYRLDYQTIWATKQPFCIDDSAFFVLPDEYEIVFNLLSTLRDLERGALRLRSLVDLYMILKGVEGFDWEQFFANRKCENVCKICVAMFSVFLNTFHCQTEFPDLARAIEIEGRTVHLGRREIGAKPLEPSRIGAKQKLWASRLYETSRMGFLLWWMISLPFRLSVYKPGKFSRLKTNTLRYFLRIAGSAASPP